MNKNIQIGLKILIFIICILCVVMGQKKIGYNGLLTMMIGLAGLLGLLWDYNRKYQ